MMVYIFYSLIYILSYTRDLGLRYTPEDAWVIPNTPIYPLKIWCEESPRKGNKIKIDWESGHLRR